MSNLENISIRIQNYKCFGETPAGFGRILPINLIVGRNNAGKSSLLDVMAHIVGPERADLNLNGHKRNIPDVQITTLLTRSGLEPAMGKTSPMIDKFIGKPLVRRFKNNGSLELVSLDTAVLREFHPSTLNQLMVTAGNPTEGKRFVRLSEARDITPELGSPSIIIKPNGSGATNAVHCYLNRTDFPSNLVEETILASLNKIMTPDASFDRIVVQILADRSQNQDHWEIFLEKGDSRIALSQMGSGLKTIILVLIDLYLVPHLNQLKMGNYIYGFEELENNLHPALQRRLFLFLREVAIAEGTTFFFTTHSNVAIDVFSKDERAQIIHVTHDGESASTNVASTYLHGKSILDDLDCRASDILQSNGIIWVEGPSDKVYVNRWIEILSGGQFIDGIHYQCMFYGGKLLAHLSADQPDDIEPTPDEIAQAIQILKINRNAIIIMDSDLSEFSGEIRATKLRIKDELRAVGGFAWITAGREIENYIPQDVLSGLYSTKPADLGQFESIAEWLDNIEPGEGKKFSRQKIDFAMRVSPQLTLDGLKSAFDLFQNVERLSERIAGWNGINPVVTTDPK